MKNENLVFAASHASISREKDIFGEGCVPNSGTVSDETIVVRAKSLKQLIAMLASEFLIDTNPDQWVLQLEDETNIHRLLFTCHESVDGFVPNAHGLQKWKEGKFDLYHVVYSFRFRCFLETPHQITDEETQGVVSLE